ncbi:hypothetical protein [Granulicoccus sp. GXG6511]|uniref:hypothetical protein n=1 Tax=Granulicoccus sp. GXG6511 TaxID=3381351 RepID=UPI003D7EAE37
MRTDPLQNLDGLRVGVRVSLRVDTADGAADRLGLVVALDEDDITVEDRAGRVHVVGRADVRLAKLVPTVARGRNPRHAAPEVLRAMAADPRLATPPEADCWVARLSDLVDHLDDSGVTPLPGTTDTRTGAARAESRGLVNGEWAAFHLVEADSLEPLAAWAARRNARNAVLTSPLPDHVLEAVGLARLGS